MPLFKINKVSSCQKLIGILIVFAILYGLISIPNHYNFRTYVFDLGYYTNAAYDYAHLTIPRTDAIEINASNILSDHLDFYLLFFAPLTYLFGTYTLLIVQVLSILFGGLGVYKYFDRPSYSVYLKWASLLYLLLFFSVFAALSFDYHSNVVAAMLLPWFFKSIRDQKWIQMLLWWGFILLAKENMSICLFGVCLGLIFQYRHTRITRNWMISLSIFSIAYFIVATQYIIPFFSMKEGFRHFQYDAIGESFSEGIMFLITSPIQTFKLMLTNHSGRIEGDYVKLEFYAYLFLGGGIVLLRKPYYLLMLLPLLMSKMLHNRINMWSADFQYGIEFAPIVAIGVFEVISKLNKKFQKKAAWLCVFLVFAVTVRKMDRPVYKIDKNRIRLYQAGHYNSKVNVSAVYREFEQIPKNASLAVQAPFFPHFSLRKNISTFPLLNGAEYVVFSTKMDRYFPGNVALIEETIQRLEQSDFWKQISNSEDVSIYKRLGNKVESEKDLFGENQNDLLYFEELTN